MISHAEPLQNTGKSVDRLPSLVMLLFSWTVIAILAATTSFIGLGGTTIGEWAAIAGYMFAFFYAWIPVSISVYFLVRYFSRRKVGWLAQLPLHLAYLLVVSASLAVLVHPLTWQSWLYGQHAVGFHSLNAFIYSTTIICCAGINYFKIARETERKAQTAERRRVALERALDKSKMDALKAQVNPHFLFNTLNSIASLVHSSSNDEAYEVVESLAALLRYALDVSRESVVPLHAELGFLQAYIDIEKIRYGERLDFEARVAEDCAHVQVPALSLQPLVENAIKHAVSVSKTPVKVTLDVRKNDDAVRIDVTDTGPGLAEPLEFGVGLSNVSERIRFLYAEAAELRIANRDAGKGAVASMRLPLG